MVIGARTGSKGGGGTYSVFYNAVGEGDGFTEQAWVEGLQQNQENRSNLALVNTGQVDGSASVFHLEIYDGETGRLVETVVTTPVPARSWHQINGILGRASAGPRGRGAATEPICPRGSSRSVATASRPGRAPFPRTSPCAADRATDAAAGPRGGQPLDRPGLSNPSFFAVKLPGRDKITTCIHRQQCSLSHGWSFPRGSR